VNNRKVLDGVRDALGIADDGQWLTVMRAIDKLDRLGIAGVQQLLGEGRKDESGDFTKGAGLKADDIALVVGAIEQGAQLDARLRDSKIGQEGRDELDAIGKLVSASGYGSDRIVIDPSVVRGLEYYTGPVYEVELLLETRDEKGRPVRFGSVGGGGRYDGLVSRFRGEPVPATGFSIGVSRLMSALKALGKVDSAGQVAPVVVLVMDKDTDSLGRYQKMVADLRRAGIRAEMYLGGSGMKPQMKYADRRGAPCVVIQGGDERGRGEVQIKDMVVGAELAAGIADHEAYKEARPGQVTVPESELVATVRGILDAQAADRRR
jgi:histidyl-tRNA synthetase